MMRTQVFISYRRSTGLYLAKAVADYLRKKGYSVFFDYSSMHNGEFNKQIFKAIEEADDVLFIWSEQALANSSNAEDWVRQELLFAYAHHKPITIIKDDGKPENIEITQPELQFLNDCPCISVTLNTFNDSLYQLRKTLRAKPTLLTGKLLKYKWIPAGILLIAGLTGIYSYTPLPSVEVTEEYNNYMLSVPRNYIDITDDIEESEAGILSLFEPDMIYADKKNYNEAVGVSIDSDLLDFEDVWEDLPPETSFAILNKLPDKSLLEKENLSIKEAAQCMEAFLSQTSILDKLRTCVKTIKGKEICFIEFTGKESKKLFRYKIAIFYMPDDVSKEENMTCTFIAGCSESVNNFRQARIFHHLEYMIKDFLKKNPTVSD